jgi:hypothetical protein
MTKKTIFSLHLSICEVQLLFVGLLNFCQVATFLHYAMLYFAEPLFQNMLVVVLKQKLMIKKIKDRL